VTPSFTPEFPNDFDCFKLTTVAIHDTSVCPNQGYRMAGTASTRHPCQRRAPVPHPHIHTTKTNHFPFPISANRTSSTTPIQWHSPPHSPPHSPWSVPLYRLLCPRCYIYHTAVWWADSNGCTWSASGHCSGGRSRGECQGCCRAGSSLSESVALHPWSLLEATLALVPCSSHPTYPPQVTHVNPHTTTTPPPPTLGPSRNSKQTLRQRGTGMLFSASPLATVRSTCLVSMSWTWRVSAGGSCPLQNRLPSKPWEGGG
jgi:hypothetical protein